MDKGAFGKEPALYAIILYPMLNRLVATFDIPNDPAIHPFWNGMLTSSSAHSFAIAYCIFSRHTSTSRQHLCKTTEIVTGLIAGFYFWDATGKTIPALPSLQSNSNETLHIDNTPFPWCKTINHRTAIGEIRSCILMDSPWAAYDHTNAGIMAKRIKSGIPEGCEQAMQMARFKLLSLVRKEDHYILSPKPVWMTQFYESDTNVRSVVPFVLDSSGDCQRSSRWVHVVLLPTRVRADSMLWDNIADPNIVSVPLVGEERGRNWDF